MRGILRLLRVSVLATVVLVGACGWPAPVGPAPSTAGDRSDVLTNNAEHTYAFVNGLWFIGHAFVPDTMYASGNVLTEQRPTRVDSVVDLRGGYVVPPFGDAHTHNLDGLRNLEEVRDAYLQEGTLYVQVLTNTHTGAEQVRSQFNRPGTLDVVYANGGLTSTLGHPFLAYEPPAMGYFAQGEWRDHQEQVCKSRIRENNAYWFVDTQADLDAKWPQILAGHPDLIKIFLHHSEVYKPLEGCENMGFQGLNPSLVPEIVGRAHAAGLRIAAHSESAHDFEVAVRGGVDLVAHLPGYGLQRDEDPAPYRISETVARLAGQRGVIVTPTLWVSESIAWEDSVRWGQMRELHASNLRLLTEAGVRFVVGSDSFGRTARGEIEAFRKFGIWDNLQLLTIWAETTPQSIFPGRRIGKLHPGYEASLLLLSCNPLEEFDCVDNIRLRFKQGTVVHIAEGTP